MKPTLLVLAAGMGSRYGGLKQLDGLGPSGETIMDYSIYDALQAGFGKVVFVIRHSFEKEFMEKVVAKYRNSIEVEVVFQELDYLPEGFTLPEEREKPWGTSHALLMAKDVIQEPFASINADDFYGRESYQMLADTLTKLSGSEKNYCMIGYLLGNTLSESGSVARGICRTDAAGNLVQIQEMTKIERVNGILVNREEDGSQTTLSDDSPVSMNMWGFTPDFFEIVERDFNAFLAANIEKPKAEFLIPTHINELVSTGEVKVKLYNIPAEWFGVTYASDRPMVVEKINQLIEQGKYPRTLF
ncbi:MAG: nucleotidyltransferase [Tannerellaceae bacterium]|nr:nucleotidyltransferase [Tannerellaceae bacterium]